MRIGPTLTSAGPGRIFPLRMSTVPAANDDVELVRRAARGDSAAMMSLYDRHCGAVLALCRRILGNRDEAEDVLQDAFVRVWQEAASYDPDRAGFRAWLCTIARNRALDVLRRRGTARKASASVEAPAEPERPDASIAADAERVRRSLDALPAPQREAIELAYYQGLTHVEIAEKTGAPLGTVKTRILDGMRKLKDMIDGGKS